MPKNISGLPNRPLRTADIEHLSEHERIATAAPYSGRPRTDRVDALILQTDQRVYGLGYDEAAREWRMIDMADRTLGTNSIEAIETTLAEWLPPEYKRWDDQQHQPQQPKPSGDGSIPGNGEADQPSSPPTRDDPESAPDLAASDPATPARAVDREMTCLRCGDSFPEAALVYEQRTSRRRRWWCPNQDCLGAGVGFDLHPVDGLDDSVFGSDR